jgi:hypothetical protein
VVLKLITIKGGNWVPGINTLLIVLIARFPPVSPISLKIGEVHRKANFSETQVDFLAGKIVFLVRASKIKIAPYS